jgi:predicted Rossmann fold nucleotide-binding protein DprA/Smf involved in DNA uptake
MKLTRRSFTLLLALTPGIGGRSLMRVLARNDLLNRSPEEFLALGESALIEEYKLLKKAASYLVTHRATMITELEPTLTKLEQLGVRWVDITDAGYPSLLEKYDPDPPAILYLYGNARLLEGQTFSVLSSRNASQFQLDLIERLAEEGVLNGEVLVSGHDKPEYQRSAVVPLRWGAPRILGLDRGFFQVLGEDLKKEAFRVARLWRYEFDPSTDLAISPFSPMAGNAGVNNQVRDRLIAGLSHRIDFVHISEGGNMGKLARLGLGAGRKVRVSPELYLDWREHGASEF